jgi:MFS family permease
MEDEVVISSDGSTSDAKDGYPTGIRLILIMTSLMLGTALMALDATIISVVTPKISTQFAALEDVGWYGAAYSMLLTATTPIASNFYKYFAPKYVYLGSIFIFEGMNCISNVIANS